MSFLQHSTTGTNNCLMSATHKEPQPLIPVHTLHTYNGTIIITIIIITIVGNCSRVTLQYQQNPPD